MTETAGRSAEKFVIAKNIEIKAPKEKVWDVLLDDKSYREWTSVFHPGSYAEGGWEKGSKVYFKAPEGDGMVSIVEEHKPEEVITFHHVGVLKNGVEDYQNEELKNWKDFRETYKVKSTGDGGTLLMIEQDITSDYFESFSDIWERALQKVKELSEK